MKVLVIGGTGHVGSFLVPMLAKAGHEVFVGTRGNTKAHSAKGFENVTFIPLDVGSRESIEGLKGYGFDTVVEFPGRAKAVWDVLADDISHLVACGSLWMFGYPQIVPTPEIAFERCFYEGYAIRFDEMQTMLEESATKKATFTAIMPPNICGPGKIPLDQYGGRSLAYHRDMANGEKVYLPDGAECLVSPCDAEDIARLFFLAVEQPEKASGFFNVGSAYALTATQFVKAYAEIYGVELVIEYLPWGKYVSEVNPEQGAWWHFYAHMCPDISRARTLLGYEPKYTPEQTLRRSVEWMKEQGMV